MDKAVIGVVLAIVAGAGTSASPAALDPLVTGSAANDVGTRHVRSTAIGTDWIQTAAAVEPSGPPSEQQTPENDNSGDTSRVGGSEPSPAPGKPGWVWWVSGAFVVMLGAGVFRLWRSGAFVTATTDGIHATDEGLATHEARADEARVTEDADEARYS